VKEAFGVGTAATIAQIELIGFDGKDYTLPSADKRIVAKKIFNELDLLKRGAAPDPFGWVVKM